MLYLKRVLSRCCLTAITLLFLLSAKAQRPEYLLFAGPQVSSAKYMVKRNNQAVESRFGFHAGFGMKVPFETNLYFTPVIFYSMKGYDVTFTTYAAPPDTAARNNSTRIHTLEVGFQLQFDMGKRPSHFFLKAGPSLDFQLKGKETFKKSDGNTVTRSMVYDFGVYGRYSANLLLQLGYETASGLYISGNYGLGLTDINNADEGPSIKHKVFGLTIGKYLRSKKIVIDTRVKE